MIEIQIIPKTSSGPILIYEEISHVVSLRVHLFSVLTRHYDGKTFYSPNWKEVCMIFIFFSFQNLLDIKQ